MKVKKHLPNGELWGKKSTVKQTGKEVEIFEGMACDEIFQSNRHRKEVESMRGFPCGFLDYTTTICYVVELTLFSTLSGAAWLLLLLLSFVAELGGSDSCLMLLMGRYSISVSMICWIFTFKPLASSQRKTSVQLEGKLFSDFQSA